MRQAVLQCAWIISIAQLSTYGGPGLQPGTTRHGLKPVPSMFQLPGRDPVRPSANKPAASAAPVGTGVLGGMVVADASGVPVRLAYVVLIGGATGVLKVTSTDRSGRFEFKDLPADRYTVAASKLPYLGAVAGARRPVRPGTPIAVTNGAKVGNITIRLPMAASVSGVIRDERGQPAPGTAVSVWQRKMQNGERVLARAGEVVTADDRGAYRIYGLPPGEYLLTAFPIRQDAARVLADDEVDAVLKGGAAPGPATADNKTYAVIYYPGTPRANDAQPITLAAGDDRQNLDFTAERVPLGRVEGFVATDDLPPGHGVTVMMETVTGSSPVSRAMSAAIGRDGKFAFTTFPGSYVLIAHVTGLQGGQFGFAQIEVGSGDTTPVQLTLQRPLTLTGKLSANGTGPLPPLSGHRLQVRSLSPALGGFGAPKVTPTNAAGEFTVTDLMPSRYVIGNVPFFGASQTSVAWGLESVWVDGKDVTDLPISMTSETLPKDVSVVLGNRWQELSGRVTDAAGAPVSDYTVMVFPVNEAYWVTGSRRIVTAQPGTDGRFVLGGPGPALLPAGEYYFAAITDVSKDEQYDPAFLRSIVGAAIKITLAPGGKQTQDLRVR